MDTYDSLVKEGGKLFDTDIHVNNNILSNRNEGLLIETVIYEWPNDVKLSIKEKLLVLSYLTAFARSDDEAQTRWATWLYSFVVMCFESMKDSMLKNSSREYLFKPLPKDLIMQIIKAETIACDEHDEDEVRYSTQVENFKFPLEFPELEVNSENFPSDLIPSRTQQAVYGFCGLLIFLAGKQINEKNASTIQDRRPNNLIATYNIPSASRHFLTGSGKLTLHAAKMCNNVWSLHYAIRKAVITDVAAFSSGKTIPVRVVYTVTKLLEFVGMQQAFFIHKFLLAFPEARQYSCLKSALSAYHNSLFKLNQVSPVIRPYFKVIEGDLTRAFHRNSILPLAAVAISYEQQFSPSIRHYNLGENASAYISRFQIEAASYGHKTLDSFTTEEESAKMD